MGLDMHLNARRYLWRGADEQIKNKIYEILPEIKPFQGDFLGGVNEIRCQVGYWRKANAIHAWFVKNVQSGVDECKPNYVSREQLIELRSLCKTVLDNRDKAQELLPPQAGFFFGGTEINEWYWNNIKGTIKIIDDALTLPDAWEFEYDSSW